MLELPAMSAAAPLSDLSRRFLTNRTGNFALNMALAMFPIMAAVGLAIDYNAMSQARSDLQNYLDSAVLAAAAPDVKDRKGAGAEFLKASVEGHYDLFGSKAAAAGITPVFAVVGDTVVGDVSYDVPLTFAAVLIKPAERIAVHSEASFASGPAGPCINILGDQSQALLGNSGAKLNAPDCEIHVHSTQNPAMILNAGVTMSINRVCLKGTKYINNGASVTKLEAGCDVAPDAFAGKIAEPTVSASCETSGVYPSGTYTLNPGVHCGPIFNGSPTITFKPGLHIIKDRMILNSGATVIAKGVTFYFPDTDSEIRANGGLSMTATAPTSGTYANILMFEKTSDAANNAKKRQYIFNGSLGEQLEGVIYLPNRDLTYNSTTNVTASKISITANTMIVNSANWKFGPYDGAGGSGKTARLTR